MTKKDDDIMVTKEVLEEAEFAKNHLMNSNLDDRCKKSLLRLLNTATIATNGISTEEKIQKITEAIQGLVLSQITFLDAVDKKIENANKAQCKSCKAMAHANAIEEEEQKEKLINEWKAANGIDDKKLSDKQQDDTWIGFLKQLLLKPGMWIVVTLLIISPYGVEIVKMMLDAFAK